MTEEIKRGCSYDWIRDREGNPRRNANGTYTMMNKNGACYTFTSETIDEVQSLLEEIRNK